MSPRSPFCSPYLLSIPDIASNEETSKKNLINFHNSHPHYTYLYNIIISQRIFLISCYKQMKTSCISHICIPFYLGIGISK